MPEKGGAREMAAFFGELLEEYKRRNPQIAKAMELFEIADRAYQAAMNVHPPIVREPSYQTLTSMARGNEFGHIQPDR